MENTTASAVRREPVGLYSHPKARPREIEPVPATVDRDRMLADRTREPAAHQQSPHLHLEPRFEGGRAFTPIEDVAEYSRPGTARPGELVESPP